jgi:hypothetical protein
MQPGQTRADAFLAELFRRTKGRALIEMISIKEIGDAIGLPQEDWMTVLMQLSGKIQAGTDSVSITAEGVTAIEATSTTSRSEPQQINVAHFHAPVSGQVQVGGSGNVQSMGHDLSEIITFVHELRTALATSDAEPEARSEIEVLTGQLEDEASQPEPRLERLQEISRALASRLTNIGWNVFAAWLQKKAGV